ncbi:hypothetical protein AAFC00_004318 [Neodothiora populina]|uniref:PSP1 C-terminal domain-containing protein n=1 Tax=Neodothiora populina TaxID=2781224 RepID=A0ABR3PJA7_9PEZI
MSFATSRGSAGRGLPAFDKSKVVMPDRTSTDADNAVLSSDDESEMIKSVNSLTNPTGPPTTQHTPRRSSFLSEIQPESKRKLSFNASGNTSQPPTPSAENIPIPWGGIGSNLVRVSSNGSTSAWTHVNSIWKDVPIGSPSTPTRGFGDDHSPIGAKDLMDDIIPFSIPLHPTPKTYRSQSYSVGQRDPDAANNRANASVVKHKPSRLSEVEHAHTLDEVHESDDEGSDSGVPVDSLRLWDGQPYMNLNQGPSSYIREEPEGPWTRRHVTAPISEHVMHTRPSGSETDHMEHSMLTDEYSAHDPGTHGLPSAFNSTRPQWQSSLKEENDFDPSLSRRHSLADVPTRRGSLALDTPPFGQAPTSHNVELHGDYQRQAADMEQSMAQNDTHNRVYAQNYFSGTAPALRSRIESTRGVPDFPNNRSLGGPDRQGPPPGVFSRPGFDTPLYIVAFKCARADIYYVQPGTGLEVNEGDLVIVEADRGYDLGTVTHARVDWTRARELKEKALDEHFRWLMMFSRHNQDIVAADPRDFHGLMAQKCPKERDPMRKAREGFGLGDAQYAHDIKPRLIRRRAFNHEIANLREKEGNEAKAKRACQQKAREHGCKMEILDAEFQIDWKKLTFYFFAEHYQNFNALVTDLYKVYKVRIWMSAINPTTYPSPSNKPPSTIGPGAMEGRDTPMDQHVGMYTDPDPHGALPPALNPSTATYNELAKDATACGFVGGNGLNPATTPFKSRLGGETQIGPMSGNPQDRNGQFQSTKNGNQASWTGFAMPQSTTRPQQPTYNSTHAQASAGASMNTAVTRPSPAPQNFQTVSPSYNGWGAPPSVSQRQAFGSTQGQLPLSFGANFNASVTKSSPAPQGMGSPHAQYPGWSAPRQPWNPANSNGRTAAPGMRPFPSELGANYIQGLGDLNLGQVERK